MWYSLKMICKRIRGSIFSYIILALQLAIGIAFISYSLNHVFSARRTLQNIEEKVQPEDVRIKADRKGDSEPPEPPVTAKEYQDIKKHLSGKTEINIYEEVLSAADDESLYVLISDGAGKELDKGTIHVPANLYRQIQQGKIDKLADDMPLEDGQMLDEWTGKRFPVKQIPEELTDKLAILSDIGTVTYSKCILLPFEEWKDRHFSNYIITVHAQGMEQVQKKAVEVLKLLEESHGDWYQYMQQNPLKEQQYYYSYMTIIPRYLGKLAVIMLVVLVFGFSGILHLHVKKREKEYAVCYAMGIESRRLCAELLSELFFVCAGGMLIGNLSCFMIMKIKVFDSLFPVYYRAGTIVLTIGIICVITVIVGAASIMKIMRQEPAKLLQSL